MEVDDLLYCVYVVEVLQLELGFQVDEVFVQCVFVLVVVGVVVNLFEYWQQCCVGYVWFVLVVFQVFDWYGVIEVGKIVQEFVVQVWCFQYCVQLCLFCRIMVEYFEYGCVFVVQYEFYYVVLQ